MGWKFRAGRSKKHETKATSLTKEYIRNDLVQCAGDLTVREFSNALPQIFPQMEYGAAASMMENNPPWIFENQGVPEWQGNGFFFLFAGL